MVRNHHQLPSRRIEYTPRTYFVRPKTCYCQQQISQHPIFPYQARDQSFSRVARDETKREKILDAADFANRENCSFIRLNDTFRKTLLNESRVQSNTRADFKLTYSENYRKLWKAFGGPGGWAINSKWVTMKKKHVPLQDSVRRYMREMSVAMFLQIQSVMYTHTYTTAKWF